MIYGFHAPEIPTLTTVRMTGHVERRREGGVEVDTSAGKLRIDMFPFGVRLRMGPTPQNDYGLLAHVPDAELASVNEDNDIIRIDSLNHRLVLHRDNLAFDLLKDGRRVIQSSSDVHFTGSLRLPPISRSETGWIINFDLPGYGRIYGFAEKWGRLDKRGQLLHSYNEDALGVNSEASYKNSPFCWSTEGWGVFCHTASTVSHSVGNPSWSQRTYATHVDDEALDVFLFSGDNGAEIVQQFMSLVGQAPVPPDWSLGVILSKAYYADADELLSAAKGVRAHHMPCDTITLDGRAWQQTETRFNFEWDETRYPNPRPIIQQLKDMDFRVCLWEYPLVSTKNKSFQEMSDNGWFLKDRNSGETFIYQWDMSAFGSVLTPLPASGIIDFTHPDAHDYWFRRHKELFELGVDMIKADFGEQVTDDMLAHNGDTGSRLHNVYAYLYNKCVYDAAQTYAKDGPFLFSRSGWTGSQRLPSLWGGDPQADWGGLVASLRGGLSWGMTGGPYYATDVGGFYGDQRDPKLYIRWVQMAVFSAHMRLHGIGPREPWSYGPTANDAVFAALQLRYRLLPYLKQQMEKAQATGLPVQRTMALMLPNEPEAWAFEEQFFFGDDIFVAPCTREDNQVVYYLPAGCWHRYPSGDVVEGGKAFRETLDLNEFVMFVREGTTIPMGPAVMSTKDNPNLSTISEYWPSTDAS